MLRLFGSAALVFGSLVPVHTPQTASQPPAADKLALSAPMMLVTFDTGKIKGDPRRLSWSPDRKTIYLQSSRINSGQQELHHFYVTIDDRAMKNAPGEPAWANEYWTKKSARSAPADPKLEIAIDVRQEHIQAGPEVLGGAMSGAALTGQTSMTSPTINAQDVSDRNLHGQDVTVYRLTLRGEMVGKGIQGEFFPGKTFGWSPAALGAIAFTDEEGHLVLMDLAKRKQVVPNTTGALLPAWSDDGTRVAFLQKTGKKQYTVYVVEVQ